MTTLLEPSCRVAFAALVHDLGKFAERARLSVSEEKLLAHITTYCPWRSLSPGGKTGYHSHLHAAWTALAFDEIERYTPDLIQGEMTPFVNREELVQSAGHADGAGAALAQVDSLVNAAAMHHRPETFLQWIIATADRVASGFEREKFDAYNAAREEISDKSPTGRNHYQARLLSLLEQIELEGKSHGVTRNELLTRYPLLPLTPLSIFPKRREETESAEDAPAQREYALLWEQFLEALGKIPPSHRAQWPLWLDHFETAWLTFTHAIASATAFGVKPEVSLFDHSKTTAALAVALWRWHVDQDKTDGAAKKCLEGRLDWDEEKFLLIQGDFFGIQDFIFADGSQTRRNAARMLRGRSFQVSLFTELAALRVLEALELPSASQITNAAGRFLIVAHNSEKVRLRVQELQSEFNEWFLKHTFGMAGLGLAAQPASCDDFTNAAPAHRFRHLTQELFEKMELAKLRRFGLTAGAPTVFDVDYDKGPCRYNERLPADDEREGVASAALSRDQIAIGRGLAQKDRLLLLRESGALGPGNSAVQLETPIFGYTIAFASSQEASEALRRLDKSRIARCWDLSLPSGLEEKPLWNGYARRAINAYVPRFSHEDIQTQAKYAGMNGEPGSDPIEAGEGKTFSHIACEDRQPLSSQDVDKPSGWRGQAALMTLKGDVDNLGQIFQSGLSDPTFAKMASISRQINAFFAVYLPALCAAEFPNTYTVFAGGDDFFLIGPWLSCQRLAERMHAEFKRYVSNNAALTFCAGMSMNKPGAPLQTLATQAENALLEAKNGIDPQHAHERKNALVVYGKRVPWSQWPQIRQAQSMLEELSQSYELSASYLYSLLGLIDMAFDRKDPKANAIWRSLFTYRTYRYVVESAYMKKNPNLRALARERLAAELGKKGIEDLGERYKIALFNYFYQQR